MQKCTNLKNLKKKFTFKNIVDLEKKKKEKKKKKKKQI